MDKYYDNQAPVVQKLDSAIQWISITMTNCVINWIVIYPLDSAIHRLNNWGQDNKVMLTLYRTAFAPVQKPYWRGPLFKHQRGDFGAISAAERSSATPISRELHIGQQFIPYRIDFRVGTTSYSV